MLMIRELTVNYGSFLAVDGVDLTVNRGEIVGLIGPNGAGKTSILQVIAGIVAPTRGRVFYEDELINHSDPRDRLAYGIVLVPETRGVFGMMSVYESRRVGAYSCKERVEIRGRMDRVFRLFPILAERRRQLVNTMSGGQQQMVAIASGLMGAPRLLVLDEPSIGLAPVVIKDIANTLSTLRDDGLTILLSEQNAKLATSISDRIYVVQAGRIQMTRSTKGLDDDPEFVESFLSLS